MKRLVSFVVSAVLVLPATGLSFELTCPVQVASNWVSGANTCPNNSPDCCPPEMPYKLSYQDPASGYTFKTCAAQPAGAFANQVTLFYGANKQLQMLCAFHYADNSMSYLSNVKVAVPSTCHFKSTNNLVSVGAGSMSCKVPTNGTPQDCVVECR